MCSKDNLNVIITKTTSELKNIFKDKLNSVILYGSYARNDFDDESDIDIMALVDLDNSELSKYYKAVSRHIEPLEMEYNVVISPAIQNLKQFEQYKDALPFFRNIVREGVFLNVQWRIY